MLPSVLFKKKSTPLNEPMKYIADFVEQLIYAGQSLFANENLNKTELEKDEKNKMIYSRSKTIFNH